MPRLSWIILVTASLTTAHAEPNAPTVVDPAVQAQRDATRLGLLQAELLTQQQKFDALQKHRASLDTPTDDSALKQADTALAEVSHNIQQLHAEIAATQEPGPAPVGATPSKRRQPRRAEPPVAAPAPWWDLYGRKPPQAEAP